MNIYNNTCKVFQIYYDRNQKSNIQPGYIPYKNTKTSINFESGIIVDLLNSKKIISSTDWVGVFSWKMNQKIQGKPISYTNIQYHVNKYQDSDIISVKPDRYWYAPIRTPHKANQTNVDGLAFNQLIQALIRMHDMNIFEDEIDIDLLLKPQYHIYCNYFIARLDVYVDFVKTYLEPVINFLSNDGIFKGVSESRSGYPYEPPEHFTKKTGFDYYPLRPFMLERLINVYRINKGLKTAFVL